MNLSVPSYYLRFISYSPQYLELQFSEARIAAVLVEEGIRLRGEETTGIEEAVKAAASWGARQLAYAQSTFAELPLWLQLLLLAIIVVSVVQWQRRRR
jgi:hypothetical protein